MNMRMLAVVLFVAMAGLGYMVWQRNNEQAVPMAEAPVTDAPIMEPSGEPGITWTAPGRWTVEPPGGVRVASYAIPAADGGTAAQCVVYFFGPGQGGSVDANIERWIGEFEDPGPAERKTFEVEGIAVHRVEVSGTYFAHAMGSGAAPVEQQNATLLGAIVEGPNGSLFLKLTGPGKTVSAAAAEFDALLNSMRPS